MGERIYGYVRVSTQEQNEARHLTAMRDFGVQEKNIVVEKVSGKDFDRPRYRRLVRALRAKDVLVVKSIDCLGRNCTEILVVYHQEAGSRHCGAGHAPAGHPAEPGPDRDAHF